MSATFQVAHGDGAVFVRAQGLANMHAAPALDALFHGLQAATVCVDLSLCSGMDSTFMGMLVGTATNLAEVGGRLVLVNPSEANRRLLTLLGITEVVPVVDSCTVPELSFVDVPAMAHQAPAARMELVRRAHLSLIELSDLNRTKFSGFLAALDADLRKRTAPDMGA